MMGEYVERIEESVTLSPQTLEITDYLQFCYEAMEAGEEDRITSDPFYTRTGDRAPMTQETADAMIEGLDAEYATELGTYPGYHRNRSGANALPEFSRLSPRARLAMAEGIDAIAERYELKAARLKEEIERAAAEAPTTNPNQNRQPGYTG